MKLYFYRLLRRKRGERRWQRGGERKKKREEWMSMKREPKGEGRREERRGDIYHLVTSLAKNEDRLPSVTEVRWISSWWKRTVSGHWRHRSHLHRVVRPMTIVFKKPTTVASTRKQNHTTANHCFFLFILFMSTHNSLMRLQLLQKQLCISSSS